MWLNIIISSLKWRNNMGKLNDKLKDVVRNWLNIVPAPGDTITIQETNTFEGNCFRNLLWYRGDASELHQYYTQIDDMMGNAKFWASDTTNDLKMRKIHTGLPAPCSLPSACVP